MLEQSSRQMTVEDSEPWFPRVRNALTDPDSFAEVFTARDEYISGKRTGQFIIRAAPMSTILSIIIGVEPARQTAADIARVRRILEIIGFRKIRPSGGWQGAAYAYDLHREAQQHLWPAIMAAKEAQKFPRHVDEEST